jgi:hypothetical protein
MGRGMRGGALLAALAVAGCGGGGGGSLPPQDADKGDPAATKAVQVEAVRAWLDPDGTKKYDNTVAIVVRNTSDKLATGVTAIARWPNSYNTSQQNAIAIPPKERAIFLLGPFKPDPPVQGDPKAEIRVDTLKPAPKQEALVKFSGIKESGKCAATGTVSNKFKHNHPGTSGLIAGLKDGKIVTAGSIFFEEPGLQPGKTGKFKADLAPLCPSDTPDEWVAYAQLGEQELAKP